MSRMPKHVDAGSLLVILATFVLFTAALLYKGLTHDLLLEAGVFLVSVKLIIMSYKNAAASDAMHAELSAIRSVLERLEPSEHARTAPPVKSC